MRIDVISIFPEIFDAVTTAGITSRAEQRQLWSLHRWNPRDFTTDSYRRVDDRPYGGGPGMVMLAEPITKTLAAVRAAQSAQLADAVGASRVILMSPQGQRLTHSLVAQLAMSPSLVIVAGRYEAIDQRFVDQHVDLEISVGDFVVSGGELPAMLLIDAMVRLLPGAVNDPESVEQESFVKDLLDSPHYTRPDTIAGKSVPPVLLSGDHSKIARWRREQALGLTASRRPDLLAISRSKGELSLEDERYLRLVGQAGDKPN